MSQSQRARRWRCRRRRRARLSGGRRRQWRSRARRRVGHAARRRRRRRLVAAALRDDADQLLRRRPGRDPVRLIALLCLRRSWFGFRRALGARRRYDQRECGGRAQCHLSDSSFHNLPGEYTGRAGRGHSSGTLNLECPRETLPHDYWVRLWPIAHVNGSNSVRRAVLAHMARISWRGTLTSACPG